MADDFFDRGGGDLYLLLLLLLLYLYIKRENARELP